jgi:hypothetical protein
MIRLVKQRRRVDLVPLYDGFVDMETQVGLLESFPKGTSGFLSSIDPLFQISRLLPSIVIVIAGARVRFDARS